MYAVQCGRYMKIGYTTDLEKRLYALNTKARGCRHPVDLPREEPAILVGRVAGDLRVERALQSAFAERIAFGEWYYRDDFLDRWAAGLEQGIPSRLEPGEIPVF